MDILIRDMCWDCFGLEMACSICNDTGMIEKWISLSQLTEEIEKANPPELILDDSIPFIDNINIDDTPNVNI